MYSGPRWETNATPSAEFQHQLTDTGTPEKQEEAVRLYRSVLKQPWMIQLPLVLSSRATAFFSATFHTMRRLSAEAEANRSGLSGHQLIAVMVFLCSDMMDLNLNSLYC